MLCYVIIMLNPWFFVFLHCVYLPPQDLLVQIFANVKFSNIFVFSHSTWYISIGNDLMCPFQIALVVHFRVALHSTVAFSVD